MLLQNTDNSLPDGDLVNTQRTVTGASGSQRLPWVVHSPREKKGL